MEIKDINLEEYEISTTDKEIIVLRKKKKSKYLKWEDLERLSGCYIADNCIIRPASNIIANGENKNVFLTEKHAKSALAMAQISQLIPYYGERSPMTSGRIVLSENILFLEGRAILGGMTPILTMNS